ncbi:chitin deacetylase 1 [Umbelopsis sp. PMI_123]|nr:chitin deacetylase 1 [Umbelopsis sp. PMI_123]
MHWKSFVAITTLASAVQASTAAAATTAAAPATSSTAVTPLSGGTNPLAITIPSIAQTTSYDPTVECQAYTVPGLTIDATQWPTIWETATSNGMNTSAEFTTLYNSIDWTKKPNAPVRKMTAAGGLDFTGYSATTDPDCWWSSSLCTIPKATDVNADIYHCQEPETWGLTYDDGPNCSHNAFYDFLVQQNLKASMFYIGSNVLDWPYGAMRGLKDGHHIADHTWSHQLMTTLTDQEVLAELYYTQKAIKYVTGVTPKYWRPAFGDVDDRVRWIATQLNLTAVIWDLDTNDWAAGSSVPETTVEQTYQDFITMGTNGTYATTGNIVLTHEIDNTTMTLAVKYLPQIKAAYKNVLDVATCNNITHPYMEDTVTITPFGNVTTNSTTASGVAPAASGSAAPATTVKNGASTLTAPASLLALVALAVFAQ